jgi:hypothetical protein
MPKTINKFENERKEVLQKVFNILEITNSNKIIALKKIDEDLVMQQKLVELVPDVKKYFICSKWNYFSNKNREFKRTYLSLIKAIMKDMKIKMMSSVIVRKMEDGTLKYETHYIFNF